MLALFCHVISIVIQPGFKFFNISLAWVTFVFRMLLISLLLYEKLYFWYPFYNCFFYIFLLLIVSFESYTNIISTQFLHFLQNYTMQ